MPFYPPGNEEYDTNGRRRSSIPPPPYAENDNRNYNRQPEMQESRQYGAGSASNLNPEAQRQAEQYWWQQREEQARYQQGYNSAPAQPQANSDNYGPTVYNQYGQPLYIPAVGQPQQFPPPYPGEALPVPAPLHNQPVAPAPESTNGSTGLYRPKGDHIVRYQRKTTFVPGSSREGSDYGSTSTRRAKTKKIATHFWGGPFSKRK